MKTETKHTAEPWRQVSQHWEGSDGRTVQLSVDCPDKRDEHRALACVNACAGMSDPAQEIIRLRAQVGKLRGALVWINGAMAEIESDGQTMTQAQAGQIVQRARAALAETEGVSSGLPLAGGRAGGMPGKVKLQ